MTSEQYLNVLADDHRPIRNAELMVLSGITPEDLGALGEVWPDIEPERRESILSRLIEISEENLDADFNDLFRFCLGDNSPGVKARAIEGLWECDDRRLVAPLIKLLEHDPSDHVRASAAMGLGKFVVLSQSGKMLSKDGGRIKESLLQAIDSVEESGVVRRRAIEAVAPFNTPEVQEIIQETYESDEIEMKCAAVYAMGKSCDTQWLSVIVSELRNPDAAMRYEASNACGELGEEPAVPHLIPLFDDDDYQAQQSAISAVGAIGGSLARKALLRCLKSSDDLAVEAAQEALDNLRDGDESLNFGSDIYPHSPRSAR